MTLKKYVEELQNMLKKNKGKFAQLFYNKFKKYNQESVISALAEIIYEHEKRLAFVKIINIVYAFIIIFVLFFK